MIKSKEDLLATVSARLEGDTSDEAISLFEDLSDTLTDMETKANGDGTDWKAKYEENDAEWRKKYEEIKNIYHNYRHRCTYHTWFFH